MKGTVHYETRGNIALMTVDNPPVNPLSSGVRQGLHDGVNAALADDAIEAVVLTGAGRAFIAGADISEFGAAASEGPGLQECLAKMEGSQKPIIAGINGTAFGGGLEVALCCDYRIAAPTAPVGLPEVKLGLLPGAGGTQRLPRLIGAEKALQFILSGDPIPAPQAKTLGIVDAVADGDIVDAALRFAEEIVAEGSKTRKIRDESTQVQADRGNEEIFAAARANAARRMRGRFAPEMIIQCVEAAVNNDDFDVGLAVEQENFRQCLAHPQREALIHMFFSEREVAKIPDVPKDTPTQTIANAAVIGCGTMGGGISMCFANAGIPVTVLEMDNDALQRGLGVIRRNYEIQVKRGRPVGRRHEPADEPHLGRHGVRGARRCGCFCRSRVREHRREGRYLQEAGRRGQRRRDSRQQHLRARHRQDGRRNRPARRRDRHALLQPGQRDATSGSGARRKDRHRDNCDRDEAG